MRVLLLYRATSTDVIIANLVNAALIRSFSLAQIRCFNIEDLDVKSDIQASVLCLINPRDTDISILNKFTDRGGKVLLPLLSA